MGYGLLGEKLGHSYSPELHRFFGGYEYDLFEVAPENLGDFLRSREFDGINVTIPYKKTLWEVCDELSASAQAIGSVNTVVSRPDGTLFGDNTDAAGFEGMIWKSRVQIPGRKCLVLGSGGASLTVQYVLKKLGAKEVIVISRSGEDNYDNLDRHVDADIIVNTTPVGMYPNTDASPVDLDAFPNCEGVLDIIYNPARTALIMQAEARHIPCLGGLYMLAEQARCACEIFTGKTVPYIHTEEAVRRLRRQKENVVLVGMPGCGKSTIGSILAEKMGREFVDSDAELEKELPVSIPDYIIRYGEEAFRQKETEVLARLGKRSGLVISTGGGIVTRPENYPLIHCNGVIVFLERELSRLPKRGRPLSQKGSLLDMYTLRLPMYRRFADITIINDQTPEVVAERVEDAYEHFSN